MHVTPEEPRGLPEQLLPLPSLLRASGLTNSCIWVVVLNLLSLAMCAACVLAKIAAVLVSSGSLELIQKWNALH